MSTAATPDAEAPVALDHEVHGEAGPVLVLIPGLGAQRHWWPPGLVTLLAEQHRVVLPDNRDTGRSPRLDHLGLAGARLQLFGEGVVPEPLYSLHAMAGDVVALLDTLEVERAHVIGVSMGGMVAQHVAFGWPERTASLTSISSTTGGPGIPPGDPEVLASLTSPTPSDTEEAYVEAATAGSRLSSNSHLFDEEDARRRHRLSYRSGLNQAAGGRQLLAVLCDGDRTERLAQVTAPTLVIHGANDPMLRVEAGRATADAIPHATLLELADVGHELPRAVHHRVAAAITEHVADAETSSA